MMIFMSGYNEGKAQTFQQCMNSCTLSSSTWSAIKRFAKYDKPCTQGPNIGASCTMGVCYKESTNYCYTPPLYEFTIEKIYYSPNCSNNCYDANMLTEITYWLLVEKYKNLFKNDPQPPMCFDYFQSVNASCFSNDTSSSIYTVFNPDDTTFYEYHTELPPVDSTMISPNSITLTGIMVPCASSY